MNQLKSFEPGKPLKKFITFALFPRYKNLISSTRIDFKFPITVLVGPNGTGKTSLLQALWSMPQGNSLGRFWFSTSIDAIEEGGVEDGQHRFVYGHWLDSQKQVVATRKARVTNVKRGADYWEPTKAVLSDEMPKMPELGQDEKIDGRTKDRWNAVERNALFLNFKSELSAYDKFMYFGRDPKRTKLKSKQDVIRRDAGKLKRLIGSDDKKNDAFYGRPITAENRLLTAKELDTVGLILGHKYIEARIIRHRLFGGQLPEDGLSVIFKRTNSTYSEAHAGSGEIAVVSTVIQILHAQKYTLIILDEPEVSLHPLAQRRFMEFLLKQCLEKFHQVILSSHSAEMFRGLPKEAIKLMEESPDGKFRVRENVIPSLAFTSIGAPTEDRLSIFVEDELAKIVVAFAIAGIEKTVLQLMDIIVIPGGAEGILKFQIPSWMMQTKIKCIALLDGDKTASITHTYKTTADIPASHDPHLGAFIKSLIGCEPQLPINGSNKAADPLHKVEMQRKYIDWYFRNTRFLPLDSPEHIEC